MSTPAQMGLCIIQPFRRWSPLVEIEAIAVVD